MDHTDRKQPALRIHNRVTRKRIFGIGRDAHQWDLAVCGMLYFVNILINILTPISQSPYRPNHRGQRKQHTEESEREEEERENKSPRSLL